MSYVLRLGLRNLARQRLRSGLAIAGIALSVALVIVGTSLMSGVQRMVFREALGEAGEIAVARQDYFDKLRFNPLKYSLKGSAAVRERLLAIDGVKAAVERIDFGFLAEHDERTATLGCSAVNVEQYARFSKIRERITAGRYLEPGEQGLLIGRLAAEELGVGPGDEVTVIGQTVYESFMADGFTVVGVFDLGAKLLNKTSLMPLAPAQEFLEMPDAVSKILVYGDDYADAGRIAGEIRAAGLLGEGIAVRPWTEDPFWGGIYAMFRAVAIGISVIICFVAGLGILNMMMVAVLERRREMGVLMALGTPRGGILASFFCEAVLYGLAGGVLGVVLGSPLALYLDHVGIDFRVDDIQGIPFPVTSTINGHFGWESVAAGLLIGVLLAVLGTLIPVAKTFGVGPQDAMSR